jgi:hypothetical protein
LDEAVATLLGWRHEDKRKKYMVFMQTGRSAEQSPRLHSLDGSIGQVLTRLAEKAKLEYGDAVEVNASDEILSEKEQAVIYWSGEMFQAFAFAQDIDKELSKRGKSELVLDHQQTMFHKKLFIYFDGLDRWAQRKYKSTVFRLADGAVLTREAISLSGPIEQDGADTDAAEEAAYDALADAEKPPEKGGLGKMKTTNLYISFALLAEDFAKNNGGYSNENGLIEDVFGNYIACLWKTANIDKEIRRLGLNAATDRTQIAQLRNDIKVIRGVGHEAVAKCIHAARLHMAARLRDG